MRNFLVYAFKPASEKDNIEIVRFPNGRPMIFPNRRLAHLQADGLWKNETWEECEAREEAGRFKSIDLSNTTSKNSYSKEEILGRTQWQGDASEAFEQTLFNPEGKPIETSEKLFSGKKIIVVSIDLDDDHYKEKPTPFHLEGDGIKVKWANPEWLKERIDKWNAENGLEKKTAKENDKVDGSVGHSTDARNANNIMDNTILETNLSAFESASSSELNSNLAGTNLSANTSEVSSTNPVPLTLLKDALENKDDKTAIIKSTDTVKLSV